MNINLVCVARNAGAAEQLPLLFAAAVEYGKSIFGEAIDHEFVGEKMAMFNADCVRGTWDVPTWWESGDEIVAVSQPAIPVDFVKTPEGIGRQHCR